MDVLVHLNSDGRPASIEAVQDALDRLVAADTLHISALREAADRVLKVRPSKRLFPAARRMLASDNNGWVVSGIALARSLGRADLVPSLVDKLDSMDQHVRTKAREAIDSINELELLPRESE